MEKFPIKLRKNYLLGEIHPVQNFEKFSDEEVSLKDCCQSDFVDAGYDDIKKGVQQGQRLSPPFIPDDWDCNKVLHVVENGSDNGVKKADIPKLPEHLVDLYTKSCERLSDSKHKLKLAEVLLKYQDSFARKKVDLGNCSLIKHRIETGTAVPIRQPLRRTPQGFEAEEEKYLKEQIDSGVVIPSKSAWASPVVLVRKKDGSVRWCIDYRKLNDATIKDAYPLPKISMCLDGLSDASVFSVCDLQSGYWLLDVAEQHRHKTAFITKYGLFEYTKMPFGLCNAPSTFQRCMELIFRGLQWKTLLIYLDDIIVYSSNLDEHFEG